MTEGGDVTEYLYKGERFEKKERRLTGSSQCWLWVTLARERRPSSSASCTTSSACITRWSVFPFCRASVLLNVFAPRAPSAWTLRSSKAAGRAGGLFVG